MYSIHEGIRGIALDPNDNSEALMPITGTLFAVGVDFHAGMLSCFAWHTYIGPFFPLFIYFFFCLYVVHAI